MAKVEVVRSLFEQINKKFKQESVKVLKHLKSVENSPKKGKVIGIVGKVIVKELRYKKFRFYFLTDNYRLKFLKKEEIEELLIKFVRMSEKKDQQKTISEIKNVLRNLGDEGFE